MPGIPHQTRRREFLTSLLARWEYAKPTPLVLAACVQQEIQPGRLRGRGLGWARRKRCSPPRVCFETDRSSWLSRSHPHGLMPITLPAPKQPLVTIGAPWADSMSVRVIQYPLQMPDIRLHAFPPSHPYRFRLLLLGGVHIRLLAMFTVELVTELAMVVF